MGREGLLKALVFLSKPSNLKETPSENTFPSIRITPLTLFKGLFTTRTKSITLESTNKNLIVDSVAVDINSTVAKKALFARKSLLFRPFSFFAQTAFHSVTNEANFLTLSAGTLHTFGRGSTYPLPGSLDKEGKWKTTVCSHR